jgi:hypothetical protein
MRNVSKPEIRSGALEPLRCRNCVRSNDEGGSAEHVAVLGIRHVAALEIMTGVTERLRCQDCARNGDSDDGAEHVTVLERKPSLCPKWGQVPLNRCVVMTVRTVTMTMVVRSTLLCSE